MNNNKKWTYRLGIDEQGAWMHDTYKTKEEAIREGIKEAKKRNPYNGFITMWAVNCMINIYEYYIECVSRAPECADNNFMWCKRYYDEVYSSLKDDISEEMLSNHYNEVMRNAYMGDKLNGIIPCMGILEFLDKLENFKIDEEQTHADKIESEDDE